jgi:hypothetical protein
MPTVVNTRGQSSNDAAREDDLFLNPMRRVDDLLTKRSDAASPLHTLKIPLPRGGVFAVKP